MTFAARFSNGQKVHGIVLALVAVCMAAAYYGGTLGHARSFTHTVRVEKTWGKPDASVPGEQVNTNFQGMVCDVYQARREVRCH